MPTTTAHRRHHRALGVMVLGALLCGISISGLINASAAPATPAAIGQDRDTAEQNRDTAEQNRDTAAGEQVTITPPEPASDAPTEALADDTAPADPTAQEPVERAEPATTPKPTEVIIPAIEVSASLVPLGLADDGAMELPDFGFAGWYDLGPLPGEDGPAVITAHLDDQQGPDVFFELEHLEPGDEVQVAREDGSVAVFIVEDSEFVRKEALPGDRIWGETDGPALRLITCGGTFDRSTGHYRSNLIVYARGA